MSDEKILLERIEQLETEVIKLSFQVTKQLKTTDKNTKSFLGYAIALFACFALLGISFEGQLYGATIAYQGSELIRFLLGTISGSSAVWAVYQRIKVEKDDRY